MHTWTRHAHHDYLVSSYAESAVSSYAESAIFNLLQACLETLRSKWSDVSQQLKTRTEEEEGQEGLPDICLLLAVVGGKEEEEEEELVQKLLEWSVEESFELIEWSIPTPSHRNSQGKLQGLDVGEDSNEERRGEGGSVRLAEALQAHMWPEMAVPSRVSHEQLLSQSDQTKHTSPTPSSSPLPPAAAAVADLTVPHEQCYNSAEEKLLAEGVDSVHDPPSGESFEHLFARFADMKGMHI